MIRKVDVVVKALKNYFNMGYGSVWTKPYLGNLFDEIVFESLREWHIQKKLERDILNGLRTNFKGLIVRNNAVSFEVDTIKRELNISVVVEILGDRDQIVFNHKIEYNS